MKKLHICYTVNQLYFKNMIVSLYSLLENNQDLEVYVYILYEDFSKDEFRKIDKVGSLFPNGHLYVLNVVPFYNILDELNIPLWRGTKIANVRLFLSQIIPACPDDMLYLDSDTIVVGDLSYLTEPSIKPVSAVLDRMSRVYWENLSSNLEHYYNSGVLQFNYNLFETNRCHEKIIDVLDKKYPLSFPDQDILNLSLYNDIATLPLEYNLFPADLYFGILTLEKTYLNGNVEFYQRDEVIHAKNYPKILHTTNFYEVRLWQKNRIHPFQELFLRYLKEIYGTVELEESSSRYANVNPYLFRLYCYASIYLPKEVKKSAKKVLVKIMKEQ